VACEAQLKIHAACIIKVACMHKLSCMCHAHKVKKNKRKQIDFSRYALLFSLLRFGLENSVSLLDVEDGNPRQVLVSIVKSIHPS